MKSQALEPNSILAFGTSKSMFGVSTSDVRKEAVLSGDERYRSLTTLVGSIPAF